MSDDKFKLPLSSYDELTKFIIAYSNVKGPTGLDEISKLTGVSRPNISKNVGFLMAAGILEGGQRKSPTMIGKKLGHALHHDMAEDVSKSWRGIVNETEFLTKLLTSVSIRNGMDSQTLEAHIAYSAGQPKKNRIMTGARTVIDILKSAELITEIDGKYVLTEPVDMQYEIADPSAQHETLPIAQQNYTVPSNIPAELPMVTSRGVNISIRININCTPDEVPGLGDQVRAMVREITESVPCEAHGNE